MIEDPVPVVIQKSILQCLALHKLQRGKSENLETFLSMTKKIEALLATVRPELAEKYNSLKIMSNPFAEENKIEVKLMIAEVHEWVTKSSWYTLFKEKMKKLWDESFFLFLFNLPFSPLHILKSIKEAQLAYLGCISRALHFMTVLKSVQKHIEKENLDGLLALFYDDNRTVDQRIIIGEKLVISLKDIYLNATAKPFPSAFARISTLTRAKDVLEAKKGIEKVEIVFGIRNAYTEHCFIGFVGPQNSGKSTLLNKLFGKNAETGRLKHTDKPTVYEVRPKLFAIDYPGTGSVENHSQDFTNFGFLNNLFIYIIRYDGTPNENLIADVVKAYSVQSMSGRASKIIFCLNQCYDENDATEFNDKLKNTFVSKIRNVIKDQNHFLVTEDVNKLIAQAAAKNQTLKTELVKRLDEKNKELKEYILKNLREDDFLFTDWLNPGQRFIKGPDDVKESIKIYVDSLNETLQGNRLI